jgi:two-component system chemotaxis sensor kinase CheA
MADEQAFANFYQEEAVELLSSLEEVVLLLEKDPENNDQINRLFRIVHTIKGSGAMFGFQKIADFAHHLETVLDTVRKRELSITPELINLLLRSRDLIQEMLYTPKEEADRNPEEMDRILAALGEFQGEIPSGIPEETFSPEEPTAAPSQTASYRVRIKLSPQVMMTGMDPLCLLKELQSLGECAVAVQTDRVPQLDGIDPEQCYLYWDVIINTGSSLEDLRSIFLFVEDEGRICITPLNYELCGEGEHHKRLGEILTERGDLTEEQVQRILAKQKRSGELMVEEGLVSQSKVDSALAEQEMVQKLKEQQQRMGNTIRVSTDKLDRLINLVGELVITQAQLSQTSGGHQDQELLAPIENVERLTNELRDCALNIRMLPIETTFGKFRRLVRDLSANLGKEIELLTEGGETELDKTVIERIHDPLVHLIRNCIDHGIEVPGERQKAGKPRRGTIRLSAGQSGGEVIISIEDDGAGIDREKLRAEGIRRNLISESDSLTDSQIFNLVFQPGFSTAVKVTDVSGRGVGMDVVRREIGKLRGSVGIESKRGQGTKISVHLPLTLAIIEGFLIAVDTNHYVVPLIFVQECIELTGQEVARSHGRHIIHVRGETIPYIRLREFFGLTGKEKGPAIEYVVIIKVEEKRVGLVIDTIVGNHQAVIKSLGKVYEHTEGISGATILGNGTIALILDVRQLVKSAHREEEQMVMSV